ncbi:MAG TPA: energy transducer TonB [Flavilitoribacter sp.]|nr:energy transducer TonB [Flavilitoribacter sp.]HMQ87610.1 energy transducer TonB [Flavilitoribacter sp.]
MKTIHVHQWAVILLALFTPIVLPGQQDEWRGIPPLRSPSKIADTKLVEQLPSFPGCANLTSEEERTACSNQRFREFIHTNLEYPAKAKNAGVEGTVVVRFTVHKDGSVGDFEILEDIGFGCGAEAVRLMQLMQDRNIKWVYFTSMMRPQDVIFSTPIQFKLK